jgi:hypothetical protein
VRKATNVNENDAARQRTERWRKWEAAFWAGVGAALKDGSPAGSYRRYGDVWVMLNFVTNEGLVQLDVVDGTYPTPGATLPGYSLKLFWDRHEPEPVVAAVLGMVEKVHADPIFRFMHKKTEPHAEDSPHRALGRLKEK